MNTKVGNKIRWKNKDKAKDKVYTPQEVAEDCMDKIRHKIKPHHHLFEPFYGKGAFYDLFGDNPKSYTEIDLGLDFFEIPDDIEIDYIITNPPYSIMTDIIKKMMKMKNLKGFGMLVNNLTMTPCRLQTFVDNGFYPTDRYYFKIHSWFGYCDFWFFEKIEGPVKPLVNMTFKKSQYMF